MRFGLPVSLAIVVVVVVVSAPVAPAQQPPRRDALEQLLGEVHQLRLAIERQATVGARVQLMASRLTLQDERVYKLSSQLDMTRRELSSLDRQVREFGMRDKQLEDVLTLESDPRQRQEMELAKKMMKSELASSLEQQEVLRAREQELTNALAIEQGKLDEVTRRLDELDRLLDR